MIRLVTMAVLALPILEIIGFVVIGGRIGLSLTLLWMLVAAMAGLALIRHGGLNALTRLQATLNQQREPGHSLIDGAVMVVAGLLLIVPGFVSDLLALILILPVTRNFLLRRAAAHFETRIYRPATAGAQSTGASRSSTVIEGEFEIVEAADAPTPPKPARRPPTTPSTIEQLDDPS